MKRIKLVHGSARVVDNVNPETVKAYNRAFIILAQQQIKEKGRKGEGSFINLKTE